VIDVKQVNYGVGQFALQQVDLHVGEGEYFVLLGPPGSGKTVLLECLCGLRRIDSGRIVLGGRDVAQLEPRQRQIAYVPQDYALFPHRSVDSNIAFGLRRQRLDKAEVKRRVDEVVEMLGIGSLLGRSVAALSGGEKQRVALARALVLRRKVLLLDEPVCALDEAIRQEICSQLRSLQRRLGLTAVHVSHNLEEAFLVADRAAVLRDGRLQQVGTMSDLLRRPANEFVARFMRCENILPARAIGPADMEGQTTVAVGEGNAGVRLRVIGRCKGELRVIVRPENLRLLSTRPSAQWLAEHGESTIRLRLAARKDCGSYLRFEMTGPVRLTAHLSHSAADGLPADEGAELLAWLPPEDLHVLGSQ